MKDRFGRNSGSSTRNLRTAAILLILAVFTVALIIWDRPADVLAKGRAGSGGGIVNFGMNSVFTSSTITGNEATTAGSASGIERSLGSLTIRNSIIAGNRNSVTTPEMTGPSTAAVDRYVSGGYNLIGNVGDITDFNKPGDQMGVHAPMLASLALNGGTTPTHALLAGSPAVLVVTKVEDTDGTCSPGDCSLREAIKSAEDGSVIQFSSLFDTPQTITLSLPSQGGFGGLNIAKGLTVEGKGAHLLTIRRFTQSNDIDRFSIITTSGDAAVTLKGMTITGGYRFAGGGIYNSGPDMTVIGCHITGNTGYGGSGGGGIRSNSPLTVINSTISNNHGGIGGGIVSFDEITVINSTISGNTAGEGGGIYHHGAGAGILHISGSTITDNGADRGGGIYTASEVRLANTIIAGNRNWASVADVHNGPGEIISMGYNLIGNPGNVASFDQPGDQTNISNPMFASLALNGGFTPTHALLPGSPAVDKGSSFGLTTDQRGSRRPVDDPDTFPASGGDNSDIGAFELGPAAAAEVSISGRILTSGGRGLGNAVVSITDPSGEKKSVFSNSLGFYSFNDVQTGRKYTVTVTSKRFRFFSREIQVDSDLNEVDFVGRE